MWGTGKNILDGRNHTRKDLHVGKARNVWGKCKISAMGCGEPGQGQKLEMRDRQAAEGCLDFTLKGLRQVPGEDSPPL